MTDLRLLVIGLFLISSTRLLRAEEKTENLGEYLDLLAARISENGSPMANAKVWEAGEPERRKRLLRMLGLDPLPERTALNVRYVGDPIELEACTFQRVVFESAPGLFVAAHLYRPKGVTFPAPAVIYVPGHSRRDKYVPHPLEYASNGYVALGLPMVGEEGRIDDDAGKCGHYGPYHDHFDWLSSGYTPAGAEVWDTMRAIDFLLTLKDKKGGRLVDGERIGMAGLSGGSARTFWATAADERISAAVACQGFTTVSNYDSTIASTCDVHLFYNYFHQSYAEVYGNAAPRALRVIQATEDPLYRNPQPVADALAKIYEVGGHPERFSYMSFPGGHGYTPDVVASEQEWLAKWLKPETPSRPEITADERKVFEANRALLDDAKNLQCFTGSRLGWRLDGKVVHAKSVREYFSKVPRPVEVTDMSTFRSMKERVLSGLKEEVLRYAFMRIPAELRLGERKDEEGLSIRSGNLIIEDILAHPVRYIAAPEDPDTTVVLLEDGDLDKALPKARDLAKDGSNVLLVEVTRLEDKHLRRYAALVGHTSTSLVINDALSAVKALRDSPTVSSKKIFVRGQGELAVAALFAGIVDPEIAGVAIEDCPDQFGVDTALLGVLRHTDLPRSGALLFPRPLEVVGEVAPGFEWTADLYRMLGREDAFVRP